MSPIGLNVYHSSGKLEGTVTDRHHEGDAWEVEVKNIERILWTLAPDTRGDHLRLK
ncbi:hypothetical protein [Alteromonas australica]|uniref:hypothetical protein n=1 Tax=Alteromonas australica TaxID=589873 RepID=UPI0024933A56|nr:hypothetical protein [Alteromonas australica]